MSALPALAEEVRFVWEAQNYGKPGYIFNDSRIEAKVTPGLGNCVLVSKARPAARIVLAARPTCAAQVAAAELQHYVQKITGARLAITSDMVSPFGGPKVLIGESKLTRSLGLENKDFKEQEYLIRSYGNMLVLMGRDEQEFGIIDYEGTGLWPDFNIYYEWKKKPEPSKKIGSVYAVDEFLERFCGVRWFMPGEIGEVCPKQDSLAVANVDLRLRPWSDYRWYGPQNFRDYFSFIGSGKPDVSYVQRHGQRGWRAINLFMMRMKVVGTEAYGANHSLIGEWFKNRFKDRPEVWDGIKAKGYGDDVKQLCLTSDSLLDVVVQDAKDYAAAKTNHERARGRYFMVMAHDYSSRWCKGDVCSKALRKDSEQSFTFWRDGASNYMWGLVDRVARRLKAELPGMWASCCAYAEYTLPPDFELSDNVAVTFCRVMPEYFSHPKYKPFARKWLTEWSKRVPRLYLWEYFDHIQSNGFEKFFPGIFLHEIEDDIRFLRSIGVKGAFNELNSIRSCVPNFAQDHLNLYVFLKLLSQDRQADIRSEELFDDYCKKFYGPAAEPMSRFFRKMEERYTNPANYKRAEGTPAHQLREVNSWARVCPPRTLRELGEMIDEAGSLALEQPFRERVELIRSAVYGMMVKNGERFAYGHIRSQKAAGLGFINRPFTIIGDNPGHVLNPGQFDLDSQGNIYLPSWDSQEVLKFNPEGEVILRIPARHGARCVCVDRQGNLYVASYRRVLKYRPDGAKAFDFASGTKCSLAKGKDVRSIAVSNNGEVWLLVGPNLIERYDKEGRLLETSRLPGEIKLKQARHIKFNGEILAILDSALRRIYLYHLDANRLEALDIPGKAALYSGLGMDRKGRIYVGVSNRIIIFEKQKDGYQKSGEFLPKHPYPIDIEFDSDENVFVATVKGLTKYDRKFEPLPDFKGEADLGADGLKDGQFACPIDLCADGQDNLFVCDFSDTKVQKLTPGGNVEWVARTKRRYNCCITIDGTGNLYVGNMSYPIVTKLSPDGKILWERGRDFLKGSVRGIASVPGGLYLAEYGKFDGQYCTKLWKLTSELEPVKDFGSNGWVFLELDGKRLAVANKITVDAAGHIYWLAGYQGIVKLKPDGRPARDFMKGTTHILNLKGKLSWTWAPDRKLVHFSDVAIAKDGTFLVLDSKDDRIVRIDSEGRYRGEFGATGYGPGQMRNISAVILSPSGVLHVADRANSRIYRIPISSIK